MTTHCIIFCNLQEITYIKSVHDIKIIRSMDRQAVLSYLFFLVLVNGTVQGRLIGLNFSGELVSDGVDDIRARSNIINSISGELSTSSSSKTTTCVHVYGFFPCAESIGGYIFQMVVYQYLLIIGERFLTRGSKKLFNILGTGVFGASLFRVLMVLPGLVMFIVSGLFTTSGNAEQQVSLGVAVYTGSTIFYLTLLWGMCVIFGKTELPESNCSTYESNGASTSTHKSKLSFLKDYGVIIDKKTGYTAGIMLLSLIPFIILQLANIFDTLFGSRLIILVALIVSALSLLPYFIYQMLIRNIKIAAFRRVYIYTSSLTWTGPIRFQVLDPWMQQRSLEYFKYQNLLSEFLQHAQRYAKGKLINKKGEPNIKVINRLFAESDIDNSQHITVEELEALIGQIDSSKLEVGNEDAVKVIMEVFDQNKDGKLSKHEFVEGCVRWIDEAKQIAGKDVSMFGNSLRQVVQPLLDGKRLELIQIEHLMSRILKNVQCEALDAGCLLNDDGKPDFDRINSLFEKFDTDKDKVISESELKNLIQTVKFGEFKLDHDEIAKNVMEDFDEDGDQVISKQEFANGVIKWLKRATYETKCTDVKRSVDEYDKILWKEVDSIVLDGEGKIRNRSKMFMLTWSFNKSALQVILGIAMLTFLVKPLTKSTQQFSNAIGIPSFFISFVIIPISTQARMAIAAIFPASQKSLKTASLTFSEIYGKVVMNNIMGMTALLAIVFAKDLKWDYSAEVLMVLVVGAVVGLLAFLRSTYPLWTCLLAFFLYPFSLILFYVVQYVWGRK